MFDWFSKKTSPENSEQGISEMFYKFNVYPDGHGDVVLCSSIEEELGYAGSFASKKEMYEIIEHLVIVMPPKSSYDKTIIIFRHRRNTG